MLWVAVPPASAREKVQELCELLKRDPNVCRACGDTFCRDPTWGDPYLIGCSKCGSKWHSFCVDTKPGKAGWRCYKCQHAPKPVLVTRPDDDPSILCQFCHRTSKGKLAGRLLAYGGLGDTTNYVHENCAFYSKGVTKKDDQWFGLHSAVRESHLTKCSFCHKKGASIPCDFPKCRKLFHYLCAKHNECYMVLDPDTQRLFCDQHMESVLRNPDMITAPKSNPSSSSTSTSSSSSTSTSTSTSSSFQIPPTPTSPDSIVAVPQANGKKKLVTRKSRRKASVPDEDGEEDNSPSCQVT